MAFYSRLADIQLDKFEHNNMVPFFGGTIKQNLNENIGSTIIEKYTGFDDSIRIEKSDQACFNDVSRNQYYDSGNSYISEYDRMEKPIFHNNILPTEQIKVGPGTKNDDPIYPSGGFQQDSFRDVNYYKTVDELRVETNPKVSYEGRTIDGQQTHLRGDVGNVEKNRVNTYYDNEHIFTTTGQKIKPKVRSCQYVKPTNRKETTREYGGSAHRDIGEYKYGKVHDPLKDQLSGYGDRHASATIYGRGSHYDHGKKSILVYGNERDLTTTKTYEGNLTTYVKSIVAPLLDTFRTSQKEYLVNNPRPKGNLQPNQPKKQTLYDPNDVAKTTIKETLIHDERSGNLKGYEQSTVYDPNDVARTTIKETTIDDERDGNMKVYTKTIVYDPDEEIRKTIRQTLDPEETVLNMSGGAKKQRVYDPNDIARTTIKETTIDNEYIGQIDSIENQSGAYLTTPQHLDPTNRQITSDFEYYGHGGNESQGDYKKTNYYADPTNKQITSDHEYYGIPDSGEYDGQMSYDDIYNAVINKTKEQTLNDRKPKGSSVKMFSGAEKMHLTQEKLVCSSNPSNYVNKVWQEPQGKEFINLTHQNNTHKGCVNDRLEPELLNAFKENPYTHPLNSVA